MILQLLKDGDKWGWSHYGDYWKILKIDLKLNEVLYKYNVYDDVVYNGPISRLYKDCLDHSSKWVKK